MKIISTQNAPEAIGPYNQAIDLGDFVFLSGQIPIDPQTGELVHGDIESQANQVFANIRAVLNEAGLSFKNVVKTTCFLIDLGEFTTFNSIYASFFEKGKEPARSTIQVAALPKGAKVEIEVIAKR